MTSRPDHRTSPWSILTYRVSSLDRQQRILQAFHDIDRPGVLALGTGPPSYPHVVVESSSLTTEGYARRVALKVDPGARSLAVTTRSARAAPVAPVLLTPPSGWHPAADIGPEGRREHE